MTKKHTVTIAIPAYNEESNIKLLLQDLSQQISDKCSIDKIIVNSDGSTDRTNELVKTFGGTNVVLIENFENRGEPFRQNEMLRLATTDVVVLINADIQIRDPYFIEKMVTPICNDEADLVSCDIKEMTPKTLFEKIVYFSMQAKKNVFLKYRDGNNIYTCHGPARALSKRFYQKLEFKQGSGEDAYSYLSCISLGYKFQYIRDTCVEYRLSNNFIDYRRQSVRFVKSKKLMEKYFGSDITKLEYRIPISILLKASIPFCIKNPLYCATYLVIYITSKITYLCMPTPPNSSISKSSKHVRDEIGGQK